MTSKNLNRYNSKWPEVKIKYFFPRSIPHRVFQNFYLVKGFYQKMLFQAIFQSKSKSFHLCMVVFLCLLAGWKLYMTPRRLTGGGLSARVLPASCWSPDSQPHVYALFYSHPDQGLTVHLMFFFQCSVLTLDTPQIDMRCLMVSLLLLLQTWKQENSINWGGGIINTHLLLCSGIPFAPSNVTTICLLQCLILTVATRKVDLRCCMLS